jgi:Adenosyl cobinamide kinase/adenosyl cobinamide phosphate guanylyltransferase
MTKERRTIVLVLGGARSGKSTYAERLAHTAEDVTYIATADSRDVEMAERIRIHRERRPAAWKTWEGESRLLPAEIGDMRGTLLLDCLTMFLTRLFLDTPEADADDETAWLERERQILQSVGTLLENFRAGAGAARLIVVSNEVGWGLVPPYRMGRRFRDMQGRANQLAASMADEAFLVAAGLPLRLKGAPETCATPG